MVSLFRKMSLSTLIILVVLSRFDLIYCCSSSDEETTTTDEELSTSEELKLGTSDANVDDGSDWADIDRWCDDAEGGIVVLWS